jgi:ankyrin repeat protein
MSGKWVRGKHLHILKYFSRMKMMNKSSKNYALLCTANNNRLAMAKYLVSKGAKISAYKYCALLNASHFGNIKMMSYFISLGVPKRILDKCLRYASDGSQTQMIKYLWRKGADISTKNNYVMKTACKEHRLSIVKMLVKRGFDLSINGNLCAEIAAKWIFSKNVKYLYQR